MKANNEFCLIGKCSDKGRVRKANEDSMDTFETGGMKVFVVCDGMGGHVGGQIASQTAVAAIRHFMTGAPITDPRDAMRGAIIAANNAILQRAKSQPELAGMGSTCVILVVTGEGKAYYGHIGDSRIYIVANHRITQLTKDHSYVQTLVDSGRITKEQAEHHPRKNEITNALGLPDMQPPTLCKEPIEPEAGNCFLLCSDGLSGMVDDQRLERMASKHDMGIQERAEKLVQMANEAGGVDNITVQLVEFAVSSASSATTSKKVNALPPLIAAAVLVFLAAVLIIFFVFFRKGKPVSNTANGPQDDTEKNFLVIFPLSQDQDTVELDHNGEQFFEIVPEDKGYIIRWKDSVTGISDADITLSLRTNENGGRSYSFSMFITGDTEPGAEGDEGQSP
jgi:serine/threonine protein phosphatase PrpC